MCGWTLCASGSSPGATKASPERPSKAAVEEHVEQLLRVYLALYTQFCAVSVSGTLSASVCSTVCTSCMLLAGEKA